MSWDKNKRPVRSRRNLELNLYLPSAADRALFLFKTIKTGTRFQSYAHKEFSHLLLKQWPVYFPCGQSRADVLPGKDANNKGLERCLWSETPHLTHSSDTGSKTWWPGADRLTDKIKSDSININKIPMRE